MDVFVPIYLSAANYYCYYAFGHVPLWYAMERYIVGLYN